MSRRRIAGIVAVLAALWLVVGAAFAQQPPQPMPPPGQPGQPQRPIPMPPSHPQFPGGPGGRPMPPGGRPGMPMPPGVRPPPGARPMRPPPPVEHEEAHKHVEHCPGHGPNDALHLKDINFAHGLLGVDNDKAPGPETSTFMPSLWRYENKTDECDPRNEPPPFLASLINFGVLAWLVVRFGKKPIAEALVKRKESIMGEIETAARLKSEAKKRLKDYKKRFETIDETLAELKAEFHAQAEAEKSRILAEAEERRVRMRRDAEFRIEQELKAARAALLEEAVLAAASGAEAILKSKVGATDHDRVNDEYIASLGRALKGGAAASRGGAA